MAVVCIPNDNCCHAICGCIVCVRFSISTSAVTEDWQRDQLEANARREEFGLSKMAHAGQSASSKPVRSPTRNGGPQCYQNTGCRGSQVSLSLGLLQHRLHSRHSPHKTLKARDRSRVCAGVSMHACEVHIAETHQRTQQGVISKLNGKIGGGEHC